MITQTLASPRKAPQKLTGLMAPFPQIFRLLPPSCGAVRSRRPSLRLPPVLSPLLGDAPARARLSFLNPTLIPTTPFHSFSFATARVVLTSLTRFSFFGLPSSATALPARTLPKLNCLSRCRSRLLLALSTVAPEASRLRRLASLFPLPFLLPGLSSVPFAVVVPVPAQRLGGHVLCRCLAAPTAASFLLPGLDGDQAAPMSLPSARLPFVARRLNLLRMHLTLLRRVWPPWSFQRRTFALQICLSNQIRPIVKASAV